MKTNDPKYLVIHCSATPAHMNIGVEEINRWHVERGFNQVGYHFIIRRDGVVQRGRPEAVIGAHTLGYNVNSLGICMVGGTDKKGRPENNFTSQQWIALYNLCTKLTNKYTINAIRGHNEVDTKACPSFSVPVWLSGKLPGAKNDGKLDKYRYEVWLSGKLPEGRSDV